MRIIIIILILLITKVTSCQIPKNLGAGWNNIFFHDYCNECFYIDTNNIWRVVIPDKEILFIEPEESFAFDEYAIMADTNRYYSRSIHSFFQIKLTWGKPDFFDIRFYHKYDFQNSIDGGIIQTSYDDGHNWFNIINDPNLKDSTYVGKTYGLYLPTDSVLSLEYQPAFTGTQANYSEVKLHFSPDSLENNGTMIMRFSMATDTTDSNNEGWMIHYIAIDGWLEDGIKKNDSNQNIEILKDPSSQKLLIYDRIEPIKRIELYTIDGRLIKHIKDSNSIDIHDIDNNIYLIRINSKYCTKILIN